MLKSLLLTQHFQRGECCWKYQACPDGNKLQIYFLKQKETLRELEFCGDYKKEN